MRPRRSVAEFSTLPTAMTERQKRRLKHLFPVLASRKHLKGPQTVDEFKTLPSRFPSFPIPFVQLGNTLVFHDDEGFRAYNAFLNILTSDKDFSRYFSAASINTVAKAHITEYIEDALEGHPRKLDANETVERILHELSSTPEEIEVHFLVNGLRLDGLQCFSLGKVAFSKIDDAYVEQLYPKTDFSKKEGTSVCPPLTEDQKREQEARTLARRQALIGRTAAKVVGRGDSWRARQEAYRECQITLGALSLYPIIFSFESKQRRIFRFTISGMSPQEFGAVIGFNIATNKRSFTMGGLASVPALHLKDEYITKFKDYGWDDVSKFLRDRSDNEIDRALETSLFWMGQAVSETLMVSAVTKYFTAIESLVIGPSWPNRIVSKVANRLGILVGPTVSEAAEIKRKVQRRGGLYGVRSQVAHAGKSELENRNTLFETGALAAWAFLRFLRARGLSSLNEAISKLDSVAARHFPDAARANRGFLSRIIGKLLGVLKRK